MLCNQCEQTAEGIGCTTIGVCGKTEGLSRLQDLLTYALQGLGIVAVAGREFDIIDDGIPRLLDIGQCNDAYSAIQVALTLPVCILPRFCILSFPCSSTAVI